MAKKKVAPKKEELKKSKVTNESKYQKISSTKEISKEERAAAFDYITKDMKNSVNNFNEKEELIFVPTKMPSLNRASIVGGWPMGTIGEAHGPNGAGKTVVGIEVLRSFIEMGHIGIFCDAERAAADKKWIGEGLKLDLDNCGYFVPDSIEDTSERINNIINSFKEGKKKGKIPEEMLLFILVDSATKLVPEEMIKNGIKKKSMGLQARLFSEWLKTLTTLVGPKENEKPCVSILFINQERKNIGAKPWEPQYYSTCGESLQYDATMRLRVSYAGKVKEGETVVGKKHKIVVEKNKVGFPDSVAYFYTSNGKGFVPVGIDTARELFEELQDCNIITKPSKGFYYCKLIDKEKKWREKDLIDYITKNEDIMEELLELHQEKVLSGELNVKSVSSIVDEFEGEDEED